MISKSNIANYSITSVWEGNKKPYAPEIAKHYAEWLQRKVFEMTGSMSVISGELQAPAVLLHISNKNGAVGKIYFEDGKLVICGGRPYELAGALNHFVKLLGEDFEFTNDFYFEQEFTSAEEILGLYPEVPDVLPYPSAHRPVPTEFPLGEGGHRGKDGLAYYPMPEDASTKLARLSGGRVVMTADEFLSTPVTDEGMGAYGEWSFVDVDDAPFGKAVHINTEKIPDIEWKMNVRFNPDVEQFGKLFEDGDVMLAKVYVKLLSGGDVATGTGKVNFSFGKHWQSKRKGRGSAITTFPSDEWQAYHLPIQTTHDYIADRFVFDICPSFNIQEVLIGGFELVNFGKKYTLDDMPSTTSVYKGADENAQWRKDALARIEKHRKGDIRIIVKDKDGRVVDGADVKLQMYEHEFDIGLNISHYYPMTSNPDPRAFRESIVENFNAYGTGHMHRKTEDEGRQLEYDVVESCYMWAKRNGCCRQLKGHALMWDTEPCPIRPDPVSGEYLSPIDYYYDKYIAKNDWDGLDRDVEKHMAWLSKRFPYMTQWDVSNEDSSRNSGSRDWSVLKRAYIPYLKEKYGEEYANEHQYDYLINWYKYARKYFPKADLVVNDIFDAKLLKYEGIQIPFLDWAVEHLDFDAIGYQGHEGYHTDPEQVVGLLDKLASYGKEVHITEYNTKATGSLSVDLDGDYQANLVRDTLIAYFACEKVNSLYFWWHKDIHPEISGLIMYYYDHRIKKSGLMMQDLFYNKWWTNESGKTDVCGEYNTRGFYGDYTVTVTKDGKEVSFDTPCHRGKDNTIVVTI